MRTVTTTMKVRLLPSLLPLLSLLLVCALVCGAGARAFAAIASTCVWEVRTTGSDSNGGGYVSGLGGTDRSQQNAAQVAIDNVAITATTAGANSNVITFVGYTPTAADLGNVVHITGGTNVTAGFYEITAWTAATWTVTGAANLTTASGAGSAITGNMGGALATPGEACGANVAFNTIWIRSGTYLITSASTNVSGGCCNPVAGSSGVTQIIGYGAVRGDGGTKPVLQASGIASASICAPGFDQWWENLTVDGANLTAIRGFGANGAISTVYNCRAYRCTDTGFVCSDARMTFLCCEADSCNVGFGVTSAIFCWSHGHTTTGFMATGSLMSCYACIASGGTSGATGFSQATGQLNNCVAYNNAGAGFVLGTRHSLAVNCVSYGNGGAGFSTSSAYAQMINCAAGSNTGGDTSNTPLLSRAFVHLTSNPFNDPAHGDFSLNNAPGGGGKLRAAGIPGTFPGSKTKSYLDIGAAQHPDPIKIRGGHLGDGG